MIKAGLVLGVEYGEGALVVDNINVQYYRAFTGSLGIQVGIGAKDVVILFYDDEAMDDFLYSSGWQVGVDGSVALLDMGAGGSLDSTESQDPIVGFVFGHKGLIAGLSLEGTKFTKIWPDADNESDDDSIEAFNENALDLSLDQSKNYFYNNSSYTYVAWCWKAGNTWQSNIAGSIPTLQQVWMVGNPRIWLYCLTLGSKSLLTR